MADEKKSVGDLIRQAWARGEPSGWFEAVYANAQKGGQQAPWAKFEPHPQFMEWAQQHNLSGKKALVVGCGLGDDAEALSALGFAVTAFDISPTAIEECKRRFPDTDVAYQVADLFNLPQAWTHTFDFVLEIRTIQSIPTHLCADVIAAISGTVNPGGRVFVMCLGREPEQEPHGIPWALSTADLAHFEANGLTQESFETLHTEPLRHFRVVYRRTV